jgi:hypothetical protein
MRYVWDQRRLGEDSDTLAGTTAMPPPFSHAHRVVITHILQGHQL